MARVAVIGGGYGGVTVAKGLDPLADVILIEQKDQFVHHAAALRAAVDTVWEHAIFMPYTNLLSRGQVVRGTVSAVHGTTVHVFGHDPIEADYVVFATGSTYPFPAKYSSYRSSVAKARLEQLHENLSRARSVMIVGGGTVGIELTGEEQGLIADWRDWDGRQQYTVLFGQGVAQTPLQTAMIFQALGNKGVRLKPRIVDAIIDADGTEHKRAVEPGERMVSEQTAASCLTLMENVVEQGHARPAKVTGYRVGGKTGTAETPSEKGGYDGNTTSFIGVAPIENPQFLVAVTMQRPEGSVGTNGTTAEFSKIMEKTLHTYNVPRSTGEPELIPLFAEDSPNKTS